MPRVSVILPVFNAENTVGRAIRSILTQSLDDLELVVVDDGSTDDTMLRITDINDTRLKVITLPHRGVAAASNIALQNSTAAYIARMDADDIAHPTKLQKQLQLLDDEDLDVVGCQVKIIDAEGNPTRTLQRYQQWINHDTASTDRIQALRFVELPLVNPTILARRKYFELGFPDNDLPEDYQLMLKAAAAGMRFGKVQNVLFDWMDGPTRLTRNDPRYSTDAFMSCRRLYLKTGPLADVPTVDLWGVGQTGKPWLRWLQTQKIHVRQAFEVSPKKIGKVIHNTPIVDADTMQTSDNVPLIIAVGAAGARDLIWNHIVERGYDPGTNAWFVA